MPPRSDHDDEFRVTPKYARRAASNYRAYVGPEWAFDLKGAFQFMVCVALGLRAHHDFCEVGCGALRAGRLFIPYLDADRYCGIDASQAVVKQAMQNEVGHDLINRKGAKFLVNATFDLALFNRRFDFMLAHAVLFHLGKGALARLFASAYRYLKPGGMLIANYHVGGDYPYDHAVYPTITRYSEETMAGFARAARLRYEPLALNDYRRNTQWFIVTHEDQPVALRPDSLAGMINQFWEGRRAQKIPK